jgi:replication factor C small subunit
MNISFFDDKPNIDELDFKCSILDKFKNINIDEMINLLFYGLAGSGKTTKIYAFLASLLDKRVYDLKNMTFEEDRKSMPYKASIFHIEVDPINLGSNEKLFIHSFLKNYVETRNIGLDIPKIVFIKNSDKLLKQTQLSLRKIVEKNSSTCKFIFEVSELSNFSEPLSSRCLLIRVLLPKINEVEVCLKNFSERRGYEITTEQIKKIIFESNRVNNLINLKKIFGFYRHYITTKKNFKFLYYDTFDEILNFINAKKISFVTLQKIRDLVNEMYINLVPMSELIIFLYNKMTYKYNNNLNFQYKLLDLTIKCDLNLKKGNKECLHVEYYIISIIDLLQNNSVVI